MSCERADHRLPLAVEESKWHVHGLVRSVGVHESCKLSEKTCVFLRKCLPFVVALCSLIFGHWLPHISFCCLVFHLYRTQLHFVFIKAYGYGTMCLTIHIKLHVREEIASDRHEKVKVWLTLAYMNLNNIEYKVICSVAS